MTKTRVLLFIIGAIVVGSVGSLVAFFARGYRFDIDKRKFSANGILVIKSNPDGAQVFIDGELTTATNATIRLTPGTYDVSVRKEGYLTWNKRLVIEKEIVTETTAGLFKSVPSLSPITFSGCLNPLPSSDLTKIAYIVPTAKEGLPADQEDKTGLWVIETVNFPVGFARDPRRITDGDLVNASWRWSPDGREMLLTTEKGSYLLDSSKFTPQNERVNISLQREDILAEWEKKRELKLNAQIRGLPEELKEILTRRTNAVVFSPDEDMILYTASSSATLPANLIKPVPGASTQQQERDIIKNHTYIYDIKEDRNFLIEENSESLTIGHLPLVDSNRRLAWFPTFRHLVLAEEGKITIMDYDGTNRQEVYSGSYVAPHGYSTATPEKLLILTNLGANDVLLNLYSLSLK